MHTSQVYNPNASWLIHADEQHIFFTYLVSILTTFRMPAFFVVSGFFCLMILNRMSTKSFINSRIQRLVIPFVVTALTLNLAQAYFLYKAGWHQEFNLNDYFHDGLWIQHLWFLANLFFYLIITALLARIKQIKIIAQYVVSKLKTLPVYLIYAFFAFTTLLIPLLGKLGFPVYSTYLHVIDVYSLLKYLGYFIFGMLLYKSDILKMKFTQINFIYYFLLLVIFIYLKNALPTDDNKIIYACYVFINGLIIYASMALLFSLFNRFMNKKSQVGRFLSDASYTVYLTHHFLVISIATLMIHYSMPPWAGFSLTVILVFSISIFIHFLLVSKIKLLSLLLNGK